MVAFTRRGIVLYCVVVVSLVHCCVVKCHVLCCVVSYFIAVYRVLSFPLPPPVCSFKDFQCVGLTSLCFKVRTVGMGCRLPWMAENVGAGIGMERSNQFLTLLKKAFVMGLEVCGASVEG